MASKKSAARVKVVRPKGEAEKLEQLQKEFDATKEMYLMTLDTQVKTANRVDNLLNIRDFSKKFWGDDKAHQNLDHYMKLLDTSIETYREIRKRSEEFALDEFVKTSVRDYYEGIVPSPENITSDLELEEAGIVFLSVQPYGQKMMQMHQYVQQCMDELGVEREETEIVDYESEH